MKRHFLHALAGMSSVLFFLAIMVSQGRFIAVSTSGTTALNEQWVVERMAFDSPPRKDFDVYTYNAWRVMPGVYRVDWSGWHQGRKYLIVESWIIFVATGCAPALLALRALKKRGDNDSARVT